MCCKIANGNRSEQLHAIPRPNAIYATPAGSQIVRCGRMYFLPVFWLLGQPGNTVSVP